MVRQPSFGRRLKALRLRVGRSQADLAGGALSPSAISLLESGLREPTSATLEALAARLGCSVAFLADGVEPLRVTDAALLVPMGEVALRQGDEQAAAGHFQQALDTGVLDPWRAVRARLGLAEATEAAGRQEEATALVEQLIADFRDQGVEPPLLVAIVLARLQRSRGLLPECRATARAALARIEELGLGGLEEYVQLCSILVGAVADGGDLALAAAEAIGALDGAKPGATRAEQAVSYRAASERAAAQNCELEALYFAERASMVGQAADGLSSPAALRMSLAWLLTRQDPPDATAALPLLVDARAELERIGDLTTLVCCETQLAQVALVEGRPQDAVRWAEAAVSRVGPELGGLELVHARLALAESQLAIGDRAPAVDCLDAAATALGQFEPSRMTAAIWSELGRLFHQAGQADEALRAYDIAVTSSR